MGKWETISQIAPGEGDVTRVSVGRSGDGDKEHEHDRDPHFTRPAEAPSQLKIISYTRCIYVVIILHERIVGVGQTGWQRQPCGSANGGVYSRLGQNQIQSRAEEGMGIDA